MSKTKLPILSGPKVSLRPPRLEDARARFELGRHAEIVRMYGGDSTHVPPLTEAQAENWVNGLIEQDYAWIIDAGSMVGHIRLHTVNMHDRSAILAIGIESPLYFNKRFGTEAIKLVQFFAFTKMDLHRLSLRVLAYNHRGIRAYEKCGFQIEGRERESAFVDNEWHDDLIMGILDREFLAK